MIKLELSHEVAADVCNLLTRETEGYSSIEEHLPERIKSIREAIVQLNKQLEDSND
jgi:hypothetical protein